jgi:putative toxin-antitoxin system antitoxin component (TIGR02293 family)
LKFQNRRRSIKLKGKVNEVATPLARQLKPLREELGVTTTQMAQLMGLAASTYSRRERSQQLAPLESHRVSELVKVLALAKKVFHGKKGAREWLHCEVPILHSETPLAVMAEPGGVGKIVNTLQRIYNGGY